MTPSPTLTELFIALAYGAVICFAFAAAVIWLQPRERRRVEETGHGH